MSRTFKGLVFAGLLCVIAAPWRAEGAIVIGAGEADGISPVFNVDSEGAQRETFLAINPANNLNLIMGWNERSAGRSGGQGFVSSFDYGATWGTSGEIFDGSLASDPAIAISPTGGALGTAVFNWIQNDNLTMRARQSFDGGVTFPGPSIIIETETSGAGIDKNWIVRDDAPGSPFFDAIYCTVSDLDGTAASGAEGHILLSASFDQGATWPVATVQIDTDGDGLIVQGSNPETFAGGATAHVWWEGTGPAPALFDIMLSTRFGGGGALFFGPSSVNAIGVPPIPMLTPVPTTGDFYGNLNNGTAGADFRVNSFPYIALDNNVASPFVGNVYILDANSAAAAAGPDTDPDILLWVLFGSTLPPTLVGPAVRNGIPILNDDGTTQDQIFPSITVAPDGAVEVFWLDTRNDPGGSPRARFDIYYTCSVDGGVTWGANTRITPATFTHAGNTFIGDYDTSATNRGGASGGGGHTWRSYVLQNAGGAGTDPTVQAVNNTGPTASVTGPVTIEDCTTPGGFMATYDASGSGDVDDDPVTYTWDVSTSNPTVGYPIVGLSTGTTPMLTIPIPFSPPSPNVYTVTVTVTDFFGATAMAVAMTTVIDMTPPVVTSALLRTILWPASRGLLPVGLSFSAVDDCDPTPTNTVSVYSTEADGAPPYAPDWLYTPAALPSTFRLRAERAFPGPGRAYVVVLNSVDDSGNRGVGCHASIVPTFPTLTSIATLNATAAAAVAACLASPTDVAPGGFVPLAVGVALP